MTLNRPEWNFTHNVYATVESVSITLVTHFPFLIISQSSHIKREPFLPAEGCSGGVLKAKVDSSQVFLRNPAGCCY